MDLLSYFTDYNVQWWPEGDNISPGWIGLQCVFCADHANHLGINLRTQRHYCWLCHTKGGMLDYIMAHERCDEAEALQIIRRYRQPREDGLNGSAQLESRASSSTSQTTHTPAVSGSILPSTIVPEWPTRHRAYLRDRGFTPVSYYIQKYDLKPVYTVGLYRFRIIIPMYVNGQVVNYTARDITGNAEERYLHCPNNKSIIQRRHLLYNIDNANRDSIVLVEGVTDVWPVGDGAVASLGTQVTDEQLAYIVDKGFRNVYILFDTGARAEAEDVQNRLAYLVDYVEILDLVDEEDPGSMSMQTAQIVRRIMYG